MSIIKPPIEELIDTSKLSTDEIKALEEYRKSVDYLADEGNNLEFNNKDEYHAAFVMAAIFRSAKKSIKIFAGNFSGEISNSKIYLDQLKNSIHGDTKVEVVFENTPNENSECLNMLKGLKKAGKNIHLSVLPPKYKKDVLDKQLNGAIGHFTIGDDRMFRYETDKNKFTAYCNFDDKNIVSTLNKNFDIFQLNAINMQ